MDKKEFNNFFRPYSRNVDNAQGVGFWKLSDSIIMELIGKYLRGHVDKKSVILDAGGGTGRWAINMSRKFPSRFIVYDLSEDMLNQAAKNVARVRLQNRIGLVRGNLTDMKLIKSNSIDFVTSIYNPISFVDNPRKAFREIFRILKRGGQALIMGQGYHNAIASKMNNYAAPAKEIHELGKTAFVKWAQQVPKLKVFSRESLSADMSSAGFRIAGSYGVPVFSQPGMEDFDPLNIKRSKVSKALDNPVFFKEALKLEMKHNGDPDIVNRGVNIFIVGKKQ
ncbi:MAG: class I SAM-dependent methyltransferase [Patescibacteria group bacterium]|nr:methyltransferase domain-containing protein [Patescibacteria group bacterium]MDE2015662.1 class I SAM-dependent methyltransferase [Patescibacteria group bacterium]MDE2226719.1 class I SAM-dependent methyltransferase [Patescibacteria group bacterium]